MRQGAKGAWLFHLPYTTEAQQGAFLYLYYLVLGKITAALNLSFIAGYHLARLISSLGLLVSGARFIARFATTTRWWLLSWGLMLWGGGTGWVLSTLGAHYVAFSSVAPDAFLYSVLFGPPHIAAAQAILLWLLPAALVPLQSKGSDPEKRSPGIVGRFKHDHWMMALGLGFGGLVLSVIRPAYTIVLLGVLGAYYLALILARRRLVLRQVAMFGLLSLPSLPYMIYVYLTFRANPTMVAWAEQNPFNTPPWSNILASIWLFLLPGLMGILSGQWWRDRDRLLLVAWIVALPILLHSPLALQRRLIGGALFALAVPAGYWLDRHLLPWSSSRWRKLLVSPLLVASVLLLTSYPLFFGLGAASFVASRPATLFITADELSALAWLGDLTTGETSPSSAPQSPPAESSPQSPPAESPPLSPPALPHEPNEA